MLSTLYGGFSSKLSLGTPGESTPFGTWTVKGFCKTTVEKIEGKNKTMVDCRTGDPSSLCEE